ncbi:hypothetical protein C8J31_102910 [Rhizobium sp. PP-CC-2G-626]|nr:hypothetical protein C8J31_102910 [Rhizobium sp. PP-CC-2G-626]
MVTTTALLPGSVSLNLALNLPHATATASGQ